MMRKNFMRSGYALWLLPMIVVRNTAHEVLYDIVQLPQVGDLIVDAQAVGPVV